MKPVLLTMWPPAILLLALVLPADDNGVVTFSEDVLFVCANTIVDGAAIIIRINPNDIMIAVKRTDGAIDDLLLLFYNIMNS